MSNTEVAREWYLRKDRTMTTAEKRSVHTDALETLGTTFEHGERDAIHLAVEPVIAGEKLFPGQDIYLEDGKALGTGRAGGLGIVDPFLEHAVTEGQQFWLVVYPRKITSLRHVWSHPGFDRPVALPKAETSKEASERWLRNFIANADCPSYETVISHAIGEGGSSQWNDEYLHFSDVDAHGEIPAEFWDHVEIVTGQKCEVRPKYFSCSC